MYSVIIQWYTKIHVKRNDSHCSQVKYLYAIKNAIKMRLKCD